MKRSLVGISIFLVCLDLSGQNFRFNLNCGYGLYQLNDLKDFQSDLKEYYSQLPIEMTEQFPGYSNYSVSGEIYLNPDNIIGINGTFYTTGARNHVKDYSGEYKLDMPLNGYRIGLQYRNILYTFNKINLYAQFKGGITLSTFKLKESFIIYNVYSTSSNATFKSLPFFVEPSLGFFYHIVNNFSLDFFLGYQIDIEGKLHRAGNKEDDLHNSAGDHIHVNWSGLRVSLGISYDLFNKNFAFQK